jgi:hypothetical protein
MSARALSFTLGLSLVGCAGLFDKSHQPPIACRSDLECAADQVCFVDGCGDPGKDIAIEVTPSARNGAYPQDFAVENLKASQTLQLYPPSEIHGALVRDQDSGGAVPYPGTVTVVLSGQSLIIPGLSRHFEATTVQGAGSYSVPVGSGVYAVSATPDDPLLPPLFDPSREITPGASVKIDLGFPRPGALSPLAGTVVRVAGTPVEAPLQIQAFDAAGQPLSQPAPVDASGAFVLSVALDTLGLGTVDLRVSPVDPQAPVPTRTFTVAPLAQLLSPLELGDFGLPFTLLGTVVDAQGQPLAGASVHVEGQVLGGGSFRSQLVQTAADGTFSLQTLPSDVGMYLFAVPPSASGPATVSTSAPAGCGLTVVPISGDPLVAQLGAIPCADRVRVSGSVLTPDGAPAAGVKVTAVPLAPVDPEDPTHPAPLEGAEALTDASGSYQLALDPARYRLDFVPGSKLPRLSRFLEVSPQTTPEEIPVEAFTLSHGRSATGHVEVLTTQGGTPEVAPLARVRFYRRVEAAGDTPSSVLLDQAYADEEGNFTVLLPTR